jgi:hypothetical protein
VIAGQENGDQAILEGIGPRRGRFDAQEAHHRAGHGLGFRLLLIERRPPWRIARRPPGGVAGIGFHQELGRFPRRDGAQVVGDVLGQRGLVTRPARLGRDRRAQGVEFGQLGHGRRGALEFQIGADRAGP